MSTDRDPMQPVKAACEKILLDSLSAGMKGVIHDLRKRGASDRAIVELVRHYAVRAGGHKNCTIVLATQAYLEKANTAEQAARGKGHSNG